MMMEGASARTTSLDQILHETWQAQIRNAFLLTDPNTADIGTREVTDDATGVAFRFRWMPHREIRGNVGELERRGILNPDRDPSKLFSDPRDPSGRHCFLCEQNIAECHPKEILVPITLAGEPFLAGANFAWIEPDHFTVMSKTHADQAYSETKLRAAVELHERSGRKYRVLLNGPEAGASIPWHFHFQVTTAALPIESMLPERADHYPTAVCRFPANDDGMAEAHQAISRWLGTDDRHSLNLLIATPGMPGVLGRGLGTGDSQSGVAGAAVAASGDPTIFFFPRHKDHAKAEGKGLVGGFEVAGDFVLSAPSEETTFHGASVAIARHILQQVCPPEWGVD